MCARGICVGEVDRRVGRTRKALSVALVDLLAEKQYHAITVQAICERADVGRSAFYQHFAGKDDLFRAGFERLRDDLGAALYAAVPATEDALIRAICAAAFYHAEKHAKLYRAATSGHGGYIALRLIEGILIEVVRKALAGDATVPPATDLRSLMVANALLTAMRWWFERHNRPGRDEMVDLVQGILLGQRPPLTTSQ